MAAKVTDVLSRTDGPTPISALFSGGCGLYSTRAWNHYGGAEYLVDRFGRLCSRGEPTRWRATDLVDAGRTASYPAPVIR